MRKAAIILVIIMVLFAGCKNDVVHEQYGSITISSSVSRTIEPNLASISCAKYIVHGTHSNGSDTFDDEFTGLSVTVEHLLVGNWSVYVEGFNADDIKIASSEIQTVVVSPASTANASFSLTYLTEGTGTLNLALRISSSDTAVAKVVFSIGDEEVAVSRPAAPEGDYFIFRTAKNLTVGQYDVLVTLYDATNTKIGISMMEVAHIYNSFTSEKMWDCNGFTSMPVFNLVSSIITENDQIILTSSTQGATIYYTTDGTDPTTKSSVYSSAITINQNTTIKAIAVANKLFPSPIATTEYRIKASTPTSSIAEGVYESSQTVSLDSETAGSTIYYTLDGSTPTKNSTIYTQPISVSKNTVIKAISVNPDYDDSEVSSFDYHIRVAVPTSSFDFNEAYETPQQIELSSITPGAVIYYTTDGSIPTNESTLYSGPITVSLTQTVKAVAYAEGFDPSPVFSEDIVIATEKVGAVSFSVESGTYYVNQTVTLSSPEGTTIYYTTDGSIPTRSSSQYAEPITVSSSQTIKAIAGKWGYLNSDVVTKEYTIKTKSPSMSVEEGRYQTAQTVVLSCETSGASIYYTVDGSEPTVGSTPYTEPITVVSTQTIKAVAQYAEWDCSEVVSVSYQIDGLAGFSVTDPVHYTLTIEVPEDWVEGEPVVENVAAILKANLAPTNPDAIYTWYVDGKLATCNNGLTITSIDELPLGIGSYNISLCEGVHSIVVKAVVDGLSLLQNYDVIVTSDAVIGTSDNAFPYDIGDVGPAGGYIFFDCDADNYTGNEDGLISTECGWRFLEVSPTDLRVVNEIPSVDSSVAGYSDASLGYFFGYYRHSSNESNDSVGTDTKIGSGATNTDSLVDAMGDNAYYHEDTSSAYAARLCSILEYAGFDDWFLPSKDELNLIYANLNIDCFDNDVEYWSSTEGAGNYAWYQNLSSGKQGLSNRYEENRILPVRAF
ncbi:MAG: chitobiase/beta-hexosaminidase C-terminal domain-containing protein [Spirochaetales bacterium]|nr:chitobiase/beta-hexosaminidase C-terminal domain-containing protein [Spirochaetales bacterium]